MGALLSKARSTVSATTEKTASSTPASKMSTFRFYANAQTSFQPPLIANGNAFLGDVFSSQELSPDTPISAGFYRLAPGPELVYTYTYDEMKIIVDGDFQISQPDPEVEGGVKEVDAKKGDVFFFPKGAVITFRTRSGGLAWYCGQRKRDGA